MPMSAYAKAIISAIAATIAYLMGAISPEGGFGDLSTNQWMGCVLVFLGALGVTYAVPNKPNPVTKS